MMAVALGKRKRRVREQERQSNTESEKEDIQAVFQRAFEARFKPLERRHAAKESEDPLPEDAHQETESDWDGIHSEDEAVRVVEYSGLTDRREGGELSKHDMKAFMSSRPPSITDKKTSPANAKATGADSDEEAETANLKHDLALQRLLKESHLLDASSGSTSLSGKHRHKAMNLRLASLGARTSVLEQERMPMAHRKGIIAKARGRDDKRRKEAQENGIILEKAMNAKKSSGSKRERGLGAPSVGSFRGGTLRLSQRDVASIHGPRQKLGGKMRPKIKR